MQSAKAHGRITRQSGLPRPGVGVRREPPPWAKFNTRLDTPFWRECREHTDLAASTPIVEYYQANGPSSFWGPTLLDPLEPFKTGGYYTLLVGMQVPYRAGRHRPTDQEARWFAGWRERNRRVALNAMTVKEALAAVHAPDWEWGNWGSGKGLYMPEAGNA